MTTFDYIIWAEIGIQQASTKQISERSSTEILDYLGDVGGVHGSLIIILYLFGEYFSSKLLSASIANSFYSQKIASKGKKSGLFEGGENSKQYEEDKKDVIQTQPTMRSKIKEEFGPIEPSMIQVLTDPICRMFCCGQSLYDCCPSTRRQNRLLEMAEDKFSEELDVAQLLMKLRDSYDLTKNMVKKEYRGLLAYQRGRVLDPEKSDDDDESSPDVSSVEEEEENETAGQKKKMTFADQMKLTVVRGIVLEQNEKEKLKKEIRKKEQVNTFLEAFKNKTLA